MDILYATVTAVLFGALIVAVRFGLQRGVDAEIGAVVPAVIGFAVAAIVALISLAFRDAGNVEALWRFLLAGLIAPGVTQVVFTRAVATAGASRVGILIGSSPVLAAALAIGFLGEPFRTALGVSTVMIVVGGAALVWEPTRPADFRSTGLVLGTVAAILIAAQSTVFRWASNGTGVSPFLATAATFCSGALCLALYLAVVRGRSTFTGLRRASLAFLPAGVLYALSYEGFTLAYQHGRVTVVAPLTATQSLWVVLFAALLFGRRREAITTRVALASVLVVAGGIVVGVFR